MTKRVFLMDQALHSYDSLIAVLQQLTLKEIETVLEIESASRRRKSLMSRLIGKAARIQGRSYAAELKRKHNHG